MNRALRHVHCDQITVVHQCQRSADVAFRAHMQNASAITRAAHAGIGDAQHIAHTLLHKLRGNRHHAPLRHAGAALRAGVAQNDDVVFRDV